MIAFLAGHLAAKTPDSATIDVAGVGYLVGVSARTASQLPTVGDEVMLYTHLHLRENEIALYGFFDPAERSAFEALIAISGIGPKVALAVLSVLTPALLATAVTTEDIATLSSVPGIGKKTAQRMILELKGSWGAVLDAGASPSVATSGASPSAATSALTEAQAALFSMGFAPAEVAEAFAGAETDGDVTTLLKYALHKLGGGI